MTAMDRAYVLIQNITYPGYVFHLRGGLTGLLYATYTEPDIITGEPTMQTTRKWHISGHAVPSEIVQTALKCVLTSQEHRVREHFLYKGERVYGPHFDVEALVEISKARRLDYRR